MSEDEAINALVDLVSFTLDKQQPDKSKMYNTLSQIEAQFQGTNSYLIEYWLGSGWQSFTSWFVRGEERKTYLSRSMEHLEQAFKLSEGKIPSKISRKGGFNPKKIDRITIAGSIGKTLVDEAIIRDLEQGLFYLDVVFKNTKNYEPILCSYAEGFYKLKDYDKAAEVGLALLDRIKRDKEWRSIIPPAVPRIIAKAYRAKAKQEKKNGNIEQAVLYFQKLVAMDIASENDRKILNKLQS